MMETLKADQRSHGPPLCLGHWTRSVEKRVRETSLNLKGICYFPAPSVLRDTTKEEQITAGQRRVIAATPPTAITMMTSATVNPEIMMNVYDLQNDDDFSNGQSRDNDERLRLAKRCQLSSPQDGPTLKRQCKGYPQLLHNGLSRRLRNLTRSRAASAPAQLKGSASFQYDSQPTRRSSPPSPMIDKASCNARAAYQEWPVYGFFKLITIGNEVRYGMEFSLEDVQQLCATTLPLHTSSAGSSTSFSALPSQI